MFCSMSAFSGQCRPSGTRNGYSSGMRIAKTSGALPFSQARPAPSPLPAQMPSGPMRNAVTGIITSIARKGTKTSCTLAGKTFCSPL